MIRVYIFVEGQTEETFASGQLQKHFSSMEIYVYPILLRTSKTGKGGVVSLGLDNIRRECRHFDRWLEKLEKLKEATTVPLKQ
jgi:hypothetical protein